MNYTANLNDIQEKEREYKREGLRLTGYLSHFGMHKSRQIPVYSVIDPIYTLTIQKTVLYGKLHPCDNCILDFSDGSVVKNLPANSGDVGLIPGSGRCLRKEEGYSPWGRKQSDMT